MKTYTLIIFSIILFSCSKKNDSISVDKFTGFRAHILIAHNDTTVYDYCDSTYVQLFEREKLVLSGWTNEKGVINFPDLEKGVECYYTFETRTYTDGFRKYHFKGKIILNRTDYYDSNKERNYFLNYYTCVGGGTGERQGNGITESERYDLFEKVAPFKAW
jgi:hypothetical protein